MHILFDGWPLIHDLASPAALHLASILTTLPDEVQPTLALPGRPDHLDWIPDRIKLAVQKTADTSRERLSWEQSRLPRLSAIENVDLIHTCSTASAFFSPIPTSSSPSGWHDAYPGQRQLNPTHLSLLERVRVSLGLGGLSRNKITLWPNDLPIEAKSRRTPVPAFVHPSFGQGQSDNLSSAWVGEVLPESFILYHGPLTENDLRRLLSIWSWAARAISAYYPLVVYGVNPIQWNSIKKLVEQSGFSDSILLLPPVDPNQLPALYHGCSLLLQSGSISPWGDPVRHGLACGKPVVAAANPITDSLVGPAGYLVPKDDERGLGAALITLVVEEEMADEMREQAVLRTTGTAKDYWAAFLSSF